MPVRFRLAGSLLPRSLREQLLSWMIGCESRLEGLKFSADIARLRNSSRSAAAVVRPLTRPSLRTRAALRLASIFVSMDS